MEKNGSPKNGSLKNHTEKHHDAATNNGERDAGNIHKTDQAPAKTRTTTTKNHVKIQSNTEAVGTTTATSTDAATESSTDSSNSKHPARPVDTNEKRDENTERIVKVPKHPELTQQQLHSEWRLKRSKLYIGNLTTDSTEEDIKELFGINNTTLLRENSTVQLHFNTKSKFRGYAILDTFTHVAEELLALNGFEFKSRKLVIEIARNVDHKSNTDKATYPYDRRGLQRGRGNQDNLATSSRRRNNAIRPAPAASSRQEETNTIGFWEQCSEEVGERDRKKQDNKTMAQELREKHRRLELEKRKQKQLLIEVECNQGHIPESALPNASLIFTALTDQMGLTNENSKRQVEAIYKPDPSNSWRWFVMFSSQSLKDSFEGKEAELSWTDDTEKTYTYHLRTKGNPKRLLITVHSSPLIDDDELREVFRTWGMVKNITHKGYDFAPHIDSGLRRAFLHLHQNVKPEDIPGHVTLSDGVSRKLYFKGKRYVCAKCSSHHTYLEGCAEQMLEGSAEEPNNNNKMTQENNTEKQQKTVQENSNKHPQTNNRSTPTDTAQQKLDSTICGRNRTTTETRTEQITRTDNLSTTEDKEERGEEDFDVAGMQTTSQQGDFPLSPCVLTTVIPESPVMIIEETPASQMDREGDNTATPAAKQDKKPMGTNRKQVGTKARATKLIDPLPLHNPRWKN